MIDLGAKFFSTLTSSRGIGGQELSQRCGEAEVAESSSDQAPDDGCGTAAGEGQGERSGESSPKHSISERKWIKWIGNTSHEFKIAKARPSRERNENCRLSSPLWPRASS